MARVVVSITTEDAEVLEQFVVVSEVVTNVELADIIRDYIVKKCTVVEDSDDEGETIN